MVIGSATSVPQNPDGFSVRVSEKQEDQYEKVVGKILEGVENTPRPSSSDKGQSLNIVA